MAIFHASVKTFSRGKGQSAVAAAAYRGGLLLSDLITGQQHDYRRRSGVVETFCLAPSHAPDWALVPGELWAVAEAAERRKDATVAREFELSLPHELSDEQRAHLAFAIAEALVDRYQFAIKPASTPQEPRMGSIITCTCLPAPGALGRRDSGKRRESWTAVCLEKYKSSGFGRWSLKRPTHTLKRLA